MRVRARHSAGMKSTRSLNGYRVVYMPEYPKAMTSDNWLGYVYEHIVVAEKSLGRALRTNEVVHHLDGARDNNKVNNLLVLERGQHAKLHAWLDRGAPGAVMPRSNRVNSTKPKSHLVSAVCEICGASLQAKQTRFCCDAHSRLASRKVKSRPPVDELLNDLSSMSFAAVGRKYGVSDNAVRKWLRQGNIEPSSKYTSRRCRD